MSITKPNRFSYKKIMESRSRQSIRKLNNYIIPEAEPVKETDNMPLTMSNKKFNLSLKNLAK